MLNKKRVYEDKFEAFGENEVDIEEDDEDDYNDDEEISDDYYIIDDEDDFYDYIDDTDVVIVNGGVGLIHYIGMGISAALGMVYIF